MNAKQLIQKHEILIEILEGIHHFTRRVNNYRESLEGIQATFPGLKSRLVHDIEIAEMCIKRLEERYFKLLKQLMKDETV
jgi:hypothetical protein